MSGGKFSPLAEKLRQMRRRRRLPAVVAAWNHLGVRVSPVAEEHHQALVAMLSEVDWALEPAPALPDELRAYLDGLDLACVIDFDVREHPAILIPASAILRFCGKLQQMYPDGFVVAGPEPDNALLVSFDEDAGPEVGRVDLRKRHGQPV